MATSGTPPPAESTLPLSEMDDAALVAQTQAGNLDAFTELVGRHDRKILRLARHITGNEEDAEDVLQESFLNAYSHIGTFAGNSKFYTWLVRITVNQALMKLRKRKTGKEVSLDEPVQGETDDLVREIAVWDETPERTYSQEEMRRILDEAIESLEPIYRTVFVLRDVEELSTEETAQTLEISVPAVKSRLLRARLQLREKLTKYFRRGKGDDAFAYL
ncbi:MAG TPA: sigma-70 family RNA polymerase sigma factor [Bryobacteraceae bacterium]|jgi:RNA polymerase sigma-70 factor, ECF subfamily|nr:sigma-70 family RNA polymerase sigma factor [Bryobacteraceae bacterium]